MIGELDEISSFERDGAALEVWSESLCADVGAAHDGNRTLMSSERYSDLTVSSTDVEYRCALAIKKFEQRILLRL